VAGRAGGVDVLQYLHEQIDIAIDQIEPTFVGLAAQAGRNADHIARGNVLIPARGDDLIGRARPAVE